MLLQAKEIPVQLPTVQVICDMLDKAEDWSKGAQLIQDSDTPPHFDKLKSMLASGRPIPVKLELLAQLESRFAAAKGWVDRAARTFMKKTSNNSLLEVSQQRAIVPLMRSNYVVVYTVHVGAISTCTCIFMYVFTKSQPATCIKVSPEVWWATQYVYTCTYKFTLTCDFQLLDTKNNCFT